MKLILILTVLITGFQLVAQSGTEVKDEVTIEKVNLPGDKPVIINNCDNCPDSLIKNGEIVYLNAMINNIGLCEYRQFVSDKKLIKCQITSKDKKSSVKIIEFYNAFTEGKHTDKQFSKTGSNFCTVTVNGNNYYLILHRHKKQKKTMLILLPE